MDSIKLSYLYFISIISAVFVLSNCGVKGRPLPPEYPPYISHGLMDSTKDISELQKTQTKEMQSKSDDNANAKPLVESADNSKTEIMDSTKKVIKKKKEKKK